MNRTLIERGTALAQDMSVYGKPLTQMSHEELLAVAALGWNHTVTMRKEKAREREQIMDIVHRARSEGRKPLWRK